MIRDRRLGRGLAALLGTPLEADIVNTPVPASGAIPTHSDGQGAEHVFTAEDLQPLDESLHGGLLLASNYPSTFD